MQDSLLLSWQQLNPVGTTTNLICSWEGQGRERLTDSPEVSRLVDAGLRFEPRGLTRARATVPLVWPSAWVPSRLKNSSYSWGFTKIGSNTTTVIKRWVLTYYLNVSPISDKLFLDLSRKLHLSGSRGLRKTSVISRSKPSGHLLTPRGC